MTSRCEYDVEQLNFLIEVTFDSAEGYEDAAEAAETSRFSDLFLERAAERRGIAARLKGMVEDLGGNPEEDGGAVAAVQRWFTHLENLTGGTDASVIAGVRTVEDRVWNAFENVLRDPRTSMDVRQSISEEFKVIMMGREYVPCLKVLQ